MNLLRTRFDTPCTIEVEHSFDYLHAHVELADDVAIHPGDKVLVHGQAIRVQYGERIVERRMATVTRASLPERLWTKMRGHFELTELYEIGFSAGRAS
ncbi:hypothetical protein [Aquisediminimonas profunda]|uniref:hypothetical protein n=1 Tax=Aquisediminimonas profunda TaxID=1550733 RepID=UPI001C62F4EC|nr:hypothetical protein [Aquisediminimonas profunda]